MRPLIAVPATLLLVYRAWSKKSLTPAGIAAATLTAVAHAVHPWNLPFALLCVFFLAGTRATHVKQDVKARLTMPSQGTSAGEGPRTHMQVLANSLVASVLSLLHTWQLYQRRAAFAEAQAGQGAPLPEGSLCFSWPGDLLVVGIIANYACVAADTFSSELGILSRGEPRLITSLTLRKVPHGTNGGVSLLGLGAGVLGSMIIVTVSVLFLPMCAFAADAGAGGWTGPRRASFMWAMTLWGALGSLVDSFLGGWLQRSVRDVRSGRIVEGEGGTRVLISSPAAGAGVSSSSSSSSSSTAESHQGGRAGAGAKTGPDVSESAVEDGDAKDEEKDKYDAKDKHRTSSFGDDRPSRIVESGFDLLDNNDVNFLMAFTMSIGAMAAAGWYWGVPLQDAFKL